MSVVRTWYWFCDGILSIRKKLCSAVGEGIISIDTSKEDIITADGNNYCCRDSHKLCQQLRLQSYLEHHCNPQLWTY